MAIGDVLAYICITTLFSNVVPESYARQSHGDQLSDCWSDMG